jgi:hypothetical protein
MFSFQKVNIVNAQLLQDTAALSLIKKGINCIYNMQFSDADEIYAKVSKMHPDQPVTIFFKGMITYWKNYPLMPKSPESHSFEEDMQRCIKLSEKSRKKTNEAENLLANLCARGILITFYANNEKRGDVFPLLAETYQQIRRSFDFTSTYPDFFFFTGLYNYYREVYAKVHPLYKAIIFIFPKGNKARGLAELQKSATSSMLLKAESYSILSYIYMSYEDDFVKASDYIKDLREVYPGNPEYLAEYIKDLLLMKQYDEAENLINSNGKDINYAYFQAQLSVFRGILQEKKYHDIVRSGEYYNSGIQGLAAFGDYGNEFAAYAWFGLSRLSDMKGDKHHQKTYRKKALDLADVKKIDFDE